MNADFVYELERYHISILCQCSLLKLALRKRYAQRIHVVNKKYYDLNKIKNTIYSFYTPTSYRGRGKFRADIEE